ncbi:MAG: peptide ABC transporter substrate-binding protein [Pyrinomonadaceae bacterium]
MSSAALTRFRIFAALLILSILIAGCSTQATSRYYGKTEAPKDNIMRYITGSEPESLDAQIPNGQPEARMLMALYDGLIEYHPKTLDPIPAIAESWEIGKDGTEYLFHIRKGATFSNGDPINANDFVYTIRRGYSPELASRNASLTYNIKYTEAYNSGQSFVKGADGKFLLKKDFAGDEAKSAEDAPEHDTLGGDTEFHRFIDSPERLTVPSDEKERTKLTEGDSKLKNALAGKEFVPVKAEDIGVEAVDDYTLRIKLFQPAPYFVALLGHQFFRVVPQKVIEKYGKAWSRPEHIVTSGAFMVKAHRPYDELILVKNPKYWDAANVRLDGIEIYPLDELTTMMNLYKAGRVDALYNHTVPAPWFDEVSPFKAEYSLSPEVADEFYVINVKKPPMDKLKVRQAFALAIDRDALAQYKRTVKPLVDMTPEGIFPKYEEAREKVYTEELKKIGSSLEQWKARKFDAEQARKLLTEAGFPVQASGSGYICPSFPIEQVGITYNTAESNKVTAEFVQAQWKRNLGITVPLNNMEFRTFVPLLNKVDYKGFGRRGWVGDYMDPYTFLGLYYARGNQGATGWWDPKYDQLLDDANRTVDPQLRYEKLAKAEFYVSQQQIIIPLYTQATSWLKKPFVKGMYPNPGTLHAWKFVYIETDESKWVTDVDATMKESDPTIDKQIETLMSTQVQREKMESAVAKSQ